MENQQDIQVLYKLIVKSLKQGVYDTPEEVITTYTALNNLNNHLASIVELQKYVQELEALRDSKKTTKK